MTDQSQFRAWKSLAGMFFDIAGQLDDKPFLWAKEGGKYRSRSWAETADEIGRLARGLRALGVEPGDRVVLVSENRPEWLIAEIAIMAAGAIAVPAYVTNTVDDHKHIITNVDASGAIVSTSKLAERLLPAAHDSKSCDFVVAIEPPELSQKLGKLEVHRWDDVLAKGAEADDDTAKLVAGLKRTDTAVIIHTSGTGGVPKGVMLSHGAIISNSMGAYDVLKSQSKFGEEVFLSFLPLSHAYEHMAGQFFPISLGAQIYYAESIDTLLVNMAEVRPTIMTAVPRLYETIYGRLRGAMNSMPKSRRKLFERTIELGSKRYEDPGSLTAGERILDAVLSKLVRKKVRARFGGRLKFFVSGGAPLNYDVGLFFTALGLKLLQGYGQTESAPLISVNPIEGTKLETVGPPVTDVEVKIDEDGEIVVRGELLMQGYYNDKASTDAVLKGGWLHTGDIGLIDNDGHLRITDRKKDIIVNSGGDNVAPQRVEGFLTLQPEISQAMVYGDKRPHLVALIVPEPEAARAWAKENGKSDDLKSVTKDAEFHEVIADAVSRVNKNLSNTERVRRFMLSDQDFTTENGMLTPSMKIRRHIINETYQKPLEALYGKG